MQNFTREFLEIAQEVCEAKEKAGRAFSWTAVSEEVYRQTGIQRGRDFYRENYLDDNFRTLIDEMDDQLDISDEEIIEEDYVEGGDVNPTLLQMKKERVKLSDERNQMSAIVRKLAREDTLKEISLEVVKTIAKDYPLIRKSKLITSTKSDREAILCLSDWHFGMEYSSVFNEYNPEIAIKRIEKLKEETIRICLENRIERLYITNLGDLISGRIHLQIRINNRYDLITQTIKICEILSQFIADLSEYFDIVYSDVNDNHSRIEPNKKESIDLESMTRLIHWYIRDRFNGYSGVKIIENEFGDDIACFGVLNHTFVSVHGDKDKPAKVIQNLTLMLRKEIDCVFTAHLHHFSADEQNHTMRVSAGSLMGIDEYAEHLRLTNRPSQNLIIVSKNNPVESIHKIILD